MSGGAFLARAPHRVSLFGGGSDIPDYLEVEGKGSSLAFAISPHITSIVKRHSGLFDERFRLNYSQTELCGSVEEINNAIARAALEAFHENGPLYISTVTDIPDRCGLSSSSSFLACLTGSLLALKREPLSKKEIARTSQKIEYGLGRACGFQDSLSIAYGGINYLTYAVSDEDGEFDIRRFPVPSCQNLVSRINNDFYMIWIGKRSAEYQRLNTRSHLANKDTIARTKDIATLAEAAWTYITESGDLSDEQIKELLNESWKIKGKALGASSPVSKDHEAALRRLECIGYKLCGAGGGGFIGCFIPDSSVKMVSDQFPGLTVIQPGLDCNGLQIYDIEEGRNVRIGE